LPGNSEEKKFLRFLTQIVDAIISKFMGFYKVAYSLKSGPFWRAIDQGRSADKPQTFTANSEKKNSLNF
jgi:hypothetical protein